MDAEHPLKSVAVDLEDGEQGTFSLLRPELPSAESYKATSATAAFVPMSIDMPPVQSVVEAVQPPPAPEGKEGLLERQLPGAESALYVHPPTAAYYPPPEAHSAPEEALPADDLLAQRLAALKQF